MVIMGLWVVAQVRPVLEQYAHLLRDTDVCWQPICDLEVAEDDLLIAVDVADFFMSGTPGQLAASAGPFFKGEHGRLVMPVIILRWSHPFADHPEPDGVYRVERCSGMGFCFPGDFSNVCFIHRRPAPFTLMASKKLEYGLRYFRRYG